MLEQPLDACISRLDGAEMGGRSDVTVVARTASRDDTIAYLSHLTFPATRLALFAVNDRWTAVVNNRLDGSDVEDHIYSFTRVCEAAGCHVVDDAGGKRRVGEYVVRDGYPARTFTLYDERGRSLRSIACALDGDRWYFGVFGEPLPAEAEFDYSARLKRNRFTSENVRSLLASLGVEPSVPEAFAAAGGFALLAERMKNEQTALEIETWACTPEEADEPGFAYFRGGLGYVQHMETHALAVVVNMTRAVLLSPALQPDAQPYLDAARRQLGDDEFDREAARIAEHLRRHGG